MNDFDNKTNGLEELIDSQSSIIRELVDTIKIQNKSIDTQTLIINRQRKDKDLDSKFIKKLIIIVIIGILLSACISNCVFYMNYFNSDFSNEIRESNTKTTNYNENKTERKIIEDLTK